MTEKKTLKIKPNTHKRLSTYGSKTDTFDDILNMLMDNTDKFVLGVKKK